MRTVGLTSLQVGHLRWIGKNRIYRSRWMGNGRSATGHPENWDQIELSGPCGWCRIRTEDWDVIRDYVVANAIPGQSMWRLTEAGEQIVEAA